jgi:hypothetical protein
VTAERADDEAVDVPVEVVLLVDVEVDVEHERVQAAELPDGEEVVAARRASVHHKLSLVVVERGQLQSRAEVYRRRANWRVRVPVAFRSARRNQDVADAVGWGRRRRAPNPVEFGGVSGPQFVRVVEVPNAGHRPLGDALLWPRWCDDRRRRSHHAGYRAEQLAALEPVPVPER